MKVYDIKVKEYSLQEVKGLDNATSVAVDLLEEKSVKIGDIKHITIKNDLGDTKTFSIDYDVIKTLKDETREVNEDDLIVVSFQSKIKKDDMIWDEIHIGDESLDDFMESIGFVFIGDAVAIDETCNDYVFNAGVGLKLRQAIG